MNIIFPDCDVCTTLTAPVQVNQITINVNSSMGWPNLSFPENVGSRFLIIVKRNFDNTVEHMWVTNTAGSTWTVERNVTSCDATRSFAVGDVVINPFPPALALAFGCFQQLEV